MYPGNFPKVVRLALALRKNTAGKPIFMEVSPITDNICNIDLVWKPVAFCKHHGYDMMTRRCISKQDKAFAYCHYENIGTITTKPGLIRSL